MHAASNVLTFLIHTLFTLYIGAIIIRIILSATRADFYNPISQFIVAITDPALLPARKIVPGLGAFDTAGWLLVFGLKAVELLLLFYLRGVQINLETLLLASVFQVAVIVISIFLYAIIIRAILSWLIVAGMPAANPLLSILNSITEPVLAPVRRIIPPVGMFDLSALVVILALYSILIALRSF